MCCVCVVCVAWHVCGVRACMLCLHACVVDVLVCGRVDVCASVPCLSFGKGRDRALP